MITIDGSFGEGGGQILRTSLTLSMITGEPFCIDKIRAGRRKPGLLRQHLTAVNAAKEISNAEVEGADIGSTRLTFRPRGIQHGEYRFSVGTAGSTTLIFQTILPALLRAQGISKVVLEGGTHNPFAPPFDFLKEVYFNSLKKSGLGVELKLLRHGFYPAGGGKFEATIHPLKTIEPFTIIERGEPVGISAKAIVSNLPVSIAERETEKIRNALSLSKGNIITGSVESNGPGNIVSITIEHEKCTEMFFGFGEKGVPAKSVAERCLKEARTYLKSTAPVGVYLADQLLLPLALAGKGEFHCLAPSKHTLTNVEVIRKFMDLSITIEKTEAKSWKVSIE